MTTAQTPAPVESLCGRLWYDMVYLTGMAGFTLGFSFRYEGSRHVPTNGPALLIANHQSFLDPWIAGLAAGRRLVFLARKTLFRNRLFGAVLRSLNAVPIDQEGVGKEGIRTVAAQLEMGKAAIVFPEGTRTPDGKLQELRPGIHLLIRKTRAPIIPIGIAGAYAAYPIWRKYPIFAPLFLPATERTIAVSVGPPLSGERFADLPRDQAMAELYNELQVAHARAEKLRRK